MPTEPQQQKPPPPDATRALNPFGAAPSPADGGATLALGQREIAEVVTARAAARNYPRDPRASIDRMLMEFMRPGLAEDAEYAYSRGGQDISGLTIRSAEVIARQWGNIVAGVKELTRIPGQSQVMTYCEDLETGWRDEKVFWVRHVRDTKKGSYQVRDERDIYEVVANYAARRKRACILAVIPIDVQEAVQRQVAITLKEKAEITPERLKAMLEKFASFSVTKEHIEKRLQRNLDSMQPAQFLSLMRIHNSLRDGMSTAPDWFEIEPAVGESAAAPGPAGTPERAKEILRGGPASGATSAPKVTTEQGGQQPTAEAPSAPANAPAEPQKAQTQFTPRDEAWINTLRAATGSREVDKIWKDIKHDYSKDGLSVPVTVEATRNEVRDKFET